MEHLGLTAPRAAVSDELLDTLQALVRDRFGIRVPADRRGDLALAQAEVAREHGYGDGSDFVQAATTLADRSPAMQGLVARITTGESYFFRDAVQMAFLRDEFLPALISQRRDGERAIRIWSAGTSEGQEIYSIAMLLHELLPQRDAWHLDLLGTDIHAGALRKAALGSYSPWSFRSVTPLQRKRCFEPDDAGGRVIEPVRAMVRFMHLNLADFDDSASLVAAGTMDLILCRNVLIYLDPGVVPRVLALLTRCLVPGGVLLLSPSDLRESRVPGLETFTRDGMYFFRKPRGDADGGADWSIPAAAPKLAAGMDFADAVDYPFDARRLAWRGYGERPLSRNPGDIGPQAALLATLRDFSARKRWRELDALARSRAELLADSPDLLLLHAAALGNLGRHADALAVCTDAIAAAPTGWQGHFLRALLHLESGDGAQARQDLKHALFLNADCVEAHYHLGCLLLAAGEPERARKSLRNARERAARRPPETPVHGVPGMTMGQLVRALRCDAPAHV